jgi:TonB family protein
MEKDFVKRVLLNMRYDSSKTLNENLNLLITESQKKTLTYTCDKDYELETAGRNYWAVDGTTFYENGNRIRNYRCEGKCPGPNCCAYAQVQYVGLTSWSSPNWVYIAYVCSERNFRDLGNSNEELISTIFLTRGGEITNSSLESKLNRVFCRSAIEVEPDYIEIDFENITIERPTEYEESGKLKTDKTSPSTKTQEEINKEILARNDADQVAPRLYASSLGFKDWKQYQEQFCCPTVKENKSEHIKCNQNIAKAMKQGWKPGDGVPEGMKSSYCKGEESISPDDVVIDNGTGTGVEGTGEGTYVNLSDTGKESLFVGETDPYFKDLKPEENIWKPEFVGGESKFNTWFDENFLYPKTALRKKQHGVSEISFVVNTDGSLSNFELVRGSGYRELDDYAIELLKTMPNWNPSTKDGVKIQSQVTLPIEFTLPE